MNWLENMIEELEELDEEEMTAVERKLRLVVGGLLKRIERLEAVTQNNNYPPELDQRPANMRRQTV